MFTRKFILSGVFTSLIAVSGFAQTIYVTNTNNAGAGSLRDAITAANANPSFTNILFNIPGTAGIERIISVPGVLPVFTAPVEVKTDLTQTGGTVLLGPTPVQSFTAFTFNTGSAGSRVEAVTFRGFVNALNILASSVTVAKNTFENTPGAGTEITLNGVSNAIISENTFTGTANAIAANGINISILSNTFNGERVVLGNSTAATIASNNFSSISKDALTLDVVDRSTIENNLFLDIAGQGIVVLSSTKNRIVRNTLPTVTGWEIFVNGGHLNNIYDNQIVGYGTFSGVLLQNGLSHTVRKNRIREGSIEMNAVSGSPVHGPVRIDSNHIVADPRNHPGHGAITLINASNAFVESNLLQDNLGHVVSLNNATNVIVRSNNMENNTGSGVYAQEGQAVKISKNIIWQNFEIAVPRPGIVSNNLKAAPVITSVKKIGTNYVISGTGTAANDTIELFTGNVSQNNVSNFNTYKFIQSVKATGSTWSVTIPASGGDFFAATSTSQNGNTSAFSAPKAIEIEGPTSAARNTTYAYATSLLPGVNYQWWIGGDASVTSGQGTSNVNITFGPSFSSAFVYVGFTHPVSGWTVYQLPVTYNSALKQASAELTIYTHAYPNPFPSTTRVQLKNNTDKPTTLHLYDGKGNQVYHSEGHPAGEAVEIGKGLPAGTYLLHVISGEEKQVIRVIKSE